MKTVRIPLLAVIFSSVFLALGKTILAPTTAKNSTVTPFVFPAAVPLPKWEPKKSSPLAEPIAESSEYLSGRHYRYTQNDLTLDIEMRYMVNTTADVKSFIENYSSMPPSPAKLSLFLRYKEGIGFYNLFAYQQRTYLSTCINSRGGITVTTSQFKLNRDSYDIRLERLLPWLLGRQNTLDMRCLWAHLSIPLKNSSPEDAYRSLETALFSWYQWWQPRFPKP